MQSFFVPLSAHLNKEMGLSHERVARIMKWSYGLEMSRRGICRALERIGKKAAPTYQQLCVPAFLKRPPGPLPRRQRYKHAALSGRTSGHHTKNG